MARRIVARQLGCPEEAVAIAHDAAGRPFLDLPQEAGLHLSLATRAGIVAVGLARHPLGVDVEQVDERAAPPLDLLHPDERSALDAVASAERPRSFARLWAAKEAYVKALGTGFARAPESFAVRLDGAERFVVTDEQNGRNASGFAKLTKNGGHESMAAAFVTLDRA